MPGYFGVMPGGNIIAAQCIGTFEKGTPFNMCITEHAGIGSAASKIFVHKIVDHKITKLFADIKNIMGKAVLDSGLAGIIKTINIAAAGFFLTATTAAVIPGLHGYSHNFITLIIEHEGRNGTVNTAAHRYQHFSISAHKKHLHPVLTPGQEAKILQLKKRKV